MDYRATLDYLFSHLPMFQRVGPAAYKEDLHNTIALCDYLGNPQQHFRSVHVAGTNGKGSVSHMLAAVCQAAGLKTGLYISPHYKDFRERIKINGRYIPRKKVVEFVQNHREAIDRIQPSFFEATVGMAFEYFAAEKVDIAIIEVGLGGRLDSTNVITPLLSVITNISFDHVNLLGDTLPKIAAEKAGIIKAGIPVVIGETHPETAAVFMEKATSCQSPIIFADQHITVQEIQQKDWESTVYNVFQEGRLFLEKLEVNISGPYQIKNLATLIQALLVLQHQIPGKYDLIGAAIRPGLGQLRALTRFMGRWQILAKNPILLVDSAHNEAGLGIAFKAIEALHPASKGRLHVVTGFVNDKDVRLVLHLFPPNARYYFAKANIPRGLEAPLLRELAAGFGLKGRAYRSVPNALRAARRAALPEDIIVVIGSIFVVAEVL